jgi:hypothetical protein
MAPNELLAFVHGESLDMPVVAEADINGQRKGDMLSKGIANFYPAWFVINLLCSEPSDDTT